MMRLFEAPENVRPGGEGLAGFSVEVHDYLLAALAEPEVALAAWQRCAARLPSVAARNLLPLAYANLKPHTPATPLKDDYLRTWGENTLLMGRAARLFDAFLEERIDFIVLKGLALLTTVYGDAGLRPMGDFDILVRPEQLEATSDLLKTQGWRPLASLPHDLRVIHALHFENELGHTLDLHWAALSECLWPGADHELWERSTTANLLGRSIDVPCPEFLLLHACVHGVHRDGCNELWVADAVKIMRRFIIDWSLLLSLARRRKVCWPLGRALQILKVRYAADIPESIPGELEPPFWDLLDRFFWYRFSKPRQFIWMPCERILDYLRSTPSPSLLDFLLHLKIRWRWRHPQQSFLSGLWCRLCGQF